MEQSQLENNKSVIITGILTSTIISVLLITSRFQTNPDFDLTVLPLLNAVLNSFTFMFLLVALIMIKRKNIKLHRRFILAAFTTTAIFLISYLTYHGIAESTHYGGDGVMKYIYFFILITHIILAAVIVPLALITLFRGLKMKVEKHRKIARWTMPIWLYVSLTGVLVYVLISPYY